MVCLIQERYNETLEAKENESPEDRAFRNGENFAYYDDLDLIESQLKVWDLNIKLIGKITPEFGKNAALE